MFEPSIDFTIGDEVVPRDESINSAIRLSQELAKAPDYITEATTVVFPDALCQATESQNWISDSDWLFTGLDGIDELGLSTDCIQHPTRSNSIEQPVSQLNTCICVNCVQYKNGEQFISDTFGQPQGPFTNPFQFGNPFCTAGLETSTTTLEALNGGETEDTLRTLTPLIKPPGLELEFNEEPNEQTSRSGTRFSRDAIRILKEWLSVHRQHPYPSDETKEKLMRQTGLKKPQVTNWLTNARRRDKGRSDPHVRSNADDQNSMVQSLISSAREGRPLSPLGNMSTSASYLRANLDSSSLDGTDDDTMISSHTISNGNDSTILSPTNDLNLSCLLGSLGKTKQKHRRGSNASNILQKKQASDSPRIFECTFCTKAFKTKHDWQRHELLHLPLEQWICVLNGPTFTTHNSAICAFCGLRDPTSNHMEQRHNYSNCAEQELKKRLFYRKDHLRQHLKGVHKADLQDQFLDTWKISTEELQSRCGLCGMTMNAWPVRVEHLSDHFKLGKTMADWKGEWGFEPRILELVTDAIPPDLIHEARRRMLPGSQAIAPPTTLAPGMDLDHAPPIGETKSLLNLPSAVGRSYPASRRRSLGGEPSNNMGLDQWIRPDEQVGQLSQVQEPTADSLTSQGPFEDADDKVTGNSNQASNLAKQLSRYISICMSANNPRCHIPTDAEIQHQARLIIYDDDGPSKQTPADNAQWLLLLKTACGVLI